MKSYPRIAQHSLHISQTLKRLGIKPPGWKTPPMLGKHHSEATKEKMRLTQRGIPRFYLRGRTLSLETRKKIGDANRGSRSANWKGGIEPENKRIRKSIEYRLWREAVFKRDDYRCYDCGRRGGDGKRLDLHPHHIYSFSKYLRLRFFVENGLTLCVACHKNTSNYAGKCNKTFIG